MSIFDPSTNHVIKSLVYFEAFGLQAPFDDSSGSLVQAGSLFRDQHQIEPHRPFPPFCLSFDPGTRRARKINKTAKVRMQEQNTVCPGVEKKTQTENCWKPPIYADPYYTTSQFRSFSDRPYFNGGSLPQPLLLQRRKDNTNKCRRKKGR